MLRDHRQLLVTFADKAAVREHVAAVAGAHYLPRVYAVVDNPDDLTTLALPDSFVMKPTHGSGAVVVVSDRAHPDAQLPPPHWGWVYSHVRPDAADRDQLVAIATHWLGQLYGQGPNREWVYGQIPPRVLIEELLTTAEGGVPDDVKLFVFHGRCHFIQLDSGRFGHRTQDFFDPSWQHLPLSGGPPWADPTPTRPDRLEELIELAETLAQGTDFVRVDLYHLPDRIVFGELTNYPAGGDSPFYPARFDRVFGQHWTVPARYS